jgi:hypothetical protein
MFRLPMYWETIWDFESNRSLGKICVLRHAVPNVWFYSAGNRTGCGSHPALYVLGTWSPSQR